MEVKWEEVQAVLPALSVEAQREITILVLEGRLSIAEARIAELEHCVEFYKEAAESVPEPAEKIVEYQ